MWALALAMMLVLACVLLYGVPEIRVANNPGWGLPGSITPSPSATIPTPRPSETPQPSPTPTITLTPTVSPTITPTLTDPPEGVGPSNYPADVNPLTGLQVDDPARLERRPVAVKVSNYPRSNRPQWGLSLADIVFEYYHNNELTRFHAIYYGQDAPMVGPIRSGRLFDMDLVELYKSILVFGSADQRILDRMLEQDYADRLVYLLDGYCPPNPVCRYDRYGRNVLITDTAQVGEYIVETGGDNDRPVLTGLHFRERVPEDGEAVNRIYIRYSYAAYNYWRYDPDSGRYIRYQDTQEDVGGRGEGYHLLVDALNNQPIQADNVVVLMIPHFFEVYVPPEGGQAATEIVGMAFEGRLTAFAFRDGQAYTLHWLRSDDGTTLQLLYPDGTPFPLKPGTTWFQVVNTHSPIEQDDGVWRFIFDLPKPEEPDE